MLSHPWLMMLIGWMCGIVTVLVVADIYFRRASRKSVNDAQQLRKSAREHEQRGIE